MRIVITGIPGQLGTELAHLFEKEHEVIPACLPDYNIADTRIIDQLASCRPDLVIHAAAITNVDGCTLDPDSAYAVNGLGTRNVALACQESSAPMVYISSNEVFDGDRDSPYLEFDDPNPINVYGRSKLIGERYAQSLLQRLYIVRTAWLYGPNGRNFVTKVLEVAQEQKQLRFVTDEIGSPTFACDLAEAIHKLVASGVYGTYHFVNVGGCSRFDFARKILDLSGRPGMNIQPISLDEYPRPSRPPRYSVLRNFCGEAIGINLRPWEDALADYISGLKG